MSATQRELPRSLYGTKSLLWHPERLTYHGLREPIVASRLAYCGKSWPIVVFRAVFRWHCSIRKEFRWLQPFVLRISVVRGTSFWVEKRKVWFREFELRQAVHGEQNPSRSLEVPWKSSKGLPEQKKQAAILLRWIALEEIGLFQPQRQFVRFWQSSYA